MSECHARRWATGSVAIAGLIPAVPAVLRRRYRNWGTTPSERRSTLPGDELIADPTGVVTRAVGIEAPAEAVWPWLAQMGQGRGGMYSYDWLENLMGLDIHSTEEIVPAWQDLAVGDRVVLVRDGWMGMDGGYSLPVVQLSPGRALVLRQQPPEHPWDAVWSFVIEPDGPRRCRLLTRSLSARQPGAAGKVAWLMGELMDPVTLIMTRRMLIGIKERAERAPATSPLPAAA